MKRRFFAAVVAHRKLVLALFVVIAVACGYCRQFVQVDYDMNDYLPADAPSTVALDVMGREFPGGITNARILVCDVSFQEAKEVKAHIGQVDGVECGLWLDDILPAGMPPEVLGESLVETYYKDGNALFSVSIDSDARISAVESIRQIIGDGNAMAGSAVNIAAGTLSTISEIRVITVLSVVFVLLVLLLMTTSWAEPLILLAGLGVAVLINAGTNLAFALAKGIVVSLVTVLTFVPALLLTCQGAIERTRHRAFVSMSERAAGRIVKVAVPLALAFALVPIPALFVSMQGDEGYWYGASHIFSDESQVTSDRLAIEEAFGVRDTYALLVPRGDVAGERELSAALHDIPQVKSVLSAVDILGPMVTGDALPAVARDMLASQEHSRMVITVEAAYEGNDTFDLVERVRAAVQAVRSSAVPILTSGIVLCGCGFALGAVSSHGVLAQLGFFLGRGVLLSLAIVLFVVPGLLYLLDGPIRVTTLRRGARRPPAGESGLRRVYCAVLGDVS